MAWILGFECPDQHETLLRCGSGALSVPSVMSGPLNALLALQPPSSGLAVPFTMLTFWFFLPAGGSLPVCSWGDTVLPYPALMSQARVFPFRLVSPGEGLVWDSSGRNL